MTGQATRPAVRDVVGVEVAREELLAVQQMLADLQREVEAEEAAADRAEETATAVTAAWQEAIERSLRVVDDLTAQREAVWQAELVRAQVEAERHLAEAGRRAAELVQTADPPVAATFGTAPPEGARSAPPVGPPLAVGPAPILVSQPAPARLPVEPSADLDAAHEEFWREESAVSAARAARAGWTPIELLLPTVALVLILAAVLLLVG